MPSLYDITSAHMQLTDYLDSGELTEEQEAQAHEYLDRLLEELLPEKVAGYCQIIKAIEADAKAHAEEAKRITERKRTLDNKARSLKERLAGALVTTGTKKLKAGTFTVAMQANPPSVVVDDVASLPLDLLVIPQPEPNKTAIKERLKAGEEIPGARLVQGESLRIR